MWGSMLNGPPDSATARSPASRGYLLRMPAALHTRDAPLRRSGPSGRLRCVRKARLKSPMLRRSTLRWNQPDSSYVPQCRSWFTVAASHDDDSAASTRLTFLKAQCASKPGSAARAAPQPQKAPRSPRQSALEMRNLPSR